MDIGNDEVKNVQNTDKKISFFRFDESNSPNMVKFVGVGRGREILKNICRMIKTQVQEIDFDIIEDNPETFPTEQSEPWNNTIVQNYIIEKDDQALTEKTHELTKNIQLLFIVADVDDSYSVPVVSELCRQICNDDSRDNNKVALVFLVPSGNKKDEESRKNVATITECATKVITFEGEDKQPVSIKKRITDVITLVCQVFMSRCTFVDYNDVATTLQMGNHIIYATGRGDGNGRAKVAVADLLQNVETNGCNLKKLKSILLYIHFPKTHQPTVEEWQTITDLILERFDNRLNILSNGSDDISDNSDSIMLNAIIVV